MLKLYNGFSIREKFRNQKNDRQRKNNYLDFRLILVLKLLFLLIMAAFSLSATIVLFVCQPMRYLSKNVVQISKVM